METKKELNQITYIISYLYYNHTTGVKTKYARDINKLIPTKTKGKKIVTFFTHHIRGLLFVERLHNSLTLLYHLDFPKTEEVFGEALQAEETIF